MMPCIQNKVLLVLSGLALLSLFLGGLVSHAPNRLISGDSIAVWHAVDGAITAAMSLALISLLIAAFLRRSMLRDWSVAIIACILIVLTVVACGQAAAGLAGVPSPAARTAPGAAAWVVLLCAALAVIDALRNLGAGLGVRITFGAAIGLAVIGIAKTGRLDALSIVQEYHNQEGLFAQEFVRHCALALGAVIPAVLIGAPLGIALAHRRKLRQPVFSTLSLLQTIPSIALFSILIGPLSALGRSVPFLGSLGVSGIGFAPAEIALVLYSLLPVVCNAYAGVIGIDPAILEAARGMGFTDRQMLWKVELPLALPLLLAGIRIAMVQAIGLVVVAALIGAGGLGTFVFQGLGQYASELVLLGALPAIFLALLADFTLRGVSAHFARKRA